VFVSLTARGRALATKLERCADDYSERILKRIPAEMREDVIHTLRVLVEAIDELPATCS
jgi:DNA-binding MarR family transcriptional regulator